MLIRTTNRKSDKVSNVRGAPVAFTSDVVERLLHAASTPVPTINSPVSQPSPPPRSVTAEKAGPMQVAASRPATNSNWIAERFRVRDAAIAFLKANCILVSIRDRQAEIPTYWVTGKKYPHTVEDVIALAQARGFEGTNAR